MRPAANMIHSSVKKVKTKLDHCFFLPLAFLFHLPGREKTKPIAILIIYSGGRFPAKAILDVGSAILFCILLSSYLPPLLSARPNPRGGL